MFLKLITSSHGQYSNKVISIPATGVVEFGFNEHSEPQVIISNGLDCVRHTLPLAYEATLYTDNMNVITSFIGAFDTDFHITPPKAVAEALAREIRCHDWTHSGYRYWTITANPDNYADIELELIHQLLETHSIFVEEKAGKLRIHVVAGRRGLDLTAIAQKLGSYLERQPRTIVLEVEDDAERYQAEAVGKFLSIFYDAVYYTRGAGYSFGLTSVSKWPLVVSDLTKTVMLEKANFEIRKGGNLIITNMGGGQ